MSTDDSAPKCEWYLDFISPYSYFAWTQRERLAARVQLEYRPVLFAALLNHWEQKGPAEITPKRQWTYRACTWWAQRRGVPFQMPAVHPFNPIAYLRMAYAAQCSPHAIDLIVRALWTTGADPRDDSVVSGLLNALGLSRANIEDRAIKDLLRHNTDRAIAAGVFGVPTFVVHDQVFWGADSLDFLEDFVANPALFTQPEMLRADRTPLGAERGRAG